mgnify:CR=1 FL=1
MFKQKHLLGIESLSVNEITEVLKLSEKFSSQNALHSDLSNVLKGMTQINLFFENSTRTQASFEIAGKRLGANVMNLNVNTSSVNKGETLMDMASTLNAMFPNLIVIRHPHSGAVQLLSEKVNCAVINAGDGNHEHPTQALLDTLTIQKRVGRVNNLNIAICGDITHSRVARSNIILHKKLGNLVRLIGPKTLIPSGVKHLGVEVTHNMIDGLQNIDIIMVLRLQKERMDGGFIASEREYFHQFGLDEAKMNYAKPDAIIMHPGPMNRGVEIDGNLADDINRSVITKQVEMGVAVRMAILDLLSRKCSERNP